MSDTPNPPILDGEDVAATEGTAIALTILGEDNPGIDDTYQQATDGKGHPVPWYYRFSGGADGNGGLSTSKSRKMKYMISWVARDKANDSVVAAPTELTAADGDTRESEGSADGAGWQWTDGRVQIKLKPKTDPRTNQTDWRIRFRWSGGGTKADESGRYGIRFVVGTPGTTVQCDPYWQYES